MVAGLGSLLLVRLDTQVWTPVGAMGRGRGSFPVVEVAGLASDGSGFGPLTAALQSDGVTVVDLQPDVAGIQPLTWNSPAPEMRIPDLATRIVAPAIDDALRRAGFDPASQVIDVVTHSIGGLIVRYLIEQTPAPTEACRGLLV